MSMEAICENKRWRRGAPSEDARGVRRSRSPKHTSGQKDGRTTHHAADAALLEFQALGVLERAKVYVAVVRHVRSASLVRCGRQRVDVKMFAVCRTLGVKLRGRKKRFHRPATDRLIRSRPPKKIKIKPF